MKSLRLQQNERKQENHSRATTHRAQGNNPMSKHSDRTAIQPTVFDMRNLAGGQLGEELQRKSAIGIASVDACSTRPRRRSLGPFSTHGRTREMRMQK